MNLFQKYQVVSCQQIYFLRVFFKKMEHILKEFLIFSNNYLKIFNFYETSKST